MIHGTHNALEDPRNEHIKIYINGSFYSRKDAKISVFDSGYLVGDGIWEALRLHKGVLVFLDEHLDRLWSGAASINLTIPFSKDALKEVLYGVLHENDMKSDVHLRVMITRGIKKTPSQDPRLTISGPNIVIIPEYKKASVESRDKGIRLFTSTVRRGSPDYLDPRLNCHSKLHEVQALIQAIHAGADEALMLDINGFVSTCNSTNFFIVKDDLLLTSTGQYCMNGITRAKVIKCAERLGMTCKQTNFSLYDVYSAQEAFVTGSFGGLTPVNEVDNRKIGTGERVSINRLQSEYESLINEAIHAEKS